MYVCVYMYICEHIYLFAFLCIYITNKCIYLLALRGYVTNDKALDYEVTVRYEQLSSYLL